MRLNCISAKCQNEFAPRLTGRVSKFRVAALLAVAGFLMSTGAYAQNWPSAGFDQTNSAYNPHEAAINTHTVGQLAPKWIFTTGGDVSARAAIAGSDAFFPDWAGNLWAVDTNKGVADWGVQLSSYGLAAKTISRTTPAVSNGVVYLGTQQGAWFLAIDAKTGALIWKTQLETVDTHAVVTVSPTVVNGVIYTGVASTEEAIPGGGPGRANGSVVALDAKSGKMLWKTQMTVAGYTGVGVWGSNPVVDQENGLMYIGTGDNYTAPTDPRYLSCISGGGVPANCQSPNNHVDSIVALDIATGAIRWSYRALTWNQYGATSGSDFFNLSCFFGIPGCPSPRGPDFDFGQSPSLITYNAGNGTHKTILGAGNKSGIYFAFDPDTGALLWQTQVGPGSALGGMEWGSATDGTRIYVADANFYGIPWGGGSAGFFAALDPATGTVLWKTADPNGAIDLGPMTVANGVVFAESMAGASTAPTMLAMDASTGQIVWSYAAGSSVIAGASVSNGTVYWGSGYTHLGIPGMTGNNKFYAFSINGH